MSQGIINFNELKSVIGDPFYEKENVLIYNMDCLEALNNINYPTIDLTVTSPPYNIGKEYEKVLELERYLDWSKKWINKIYDVTKPDGALLLNIGYVEVEGKGKAVPLPYLLWDKSKFYLIQEIVWNYGAGVACKKQLSPRNEKILWFVKNQNNYVFNLDDIRDKDVKYPNQKKNGKLRCNTLGKNPSDVWQIAKVTSGYNRASPERTPHPAQFPMDLIERTIKGFSNVGDLICDPFMGSGTVAEVALRHNRKFIGFEINKTYCEYAIKRVESYFTEQASSLGNYLQ